MLFVLMAYRVPTWTIALVKSPGQYPRDSSHPEFLRSVSTFGEHCPVAFSRGNGYAGVFQEEIIWEGRESSGHGHGHTVYTSIPAIKILHGT